MNTLAVQQNQVDFGFDFFHMPFNQSLYSFAMLMKSP
jgi:hypothetical protein